MAEPQFSNPNEDDLPRTFRREREAQRQAQAQAALNQSKPATISSGGYGPDTGRGPAHDRSPGEGPRVTVTAFDVPFLKMVIFYLKAAVAAIPALILLGLIMFLIGQTAQKFLPWLVKMRILITFP